MSSVFGGSKQKSQATSLSNNQAFGTINSWASDLMPYAGEGARGLSSLLGGDATGLNKFKQTIGFDNMLEQGSRGVTGNAAANGLLRSGGTSKGLARFAAGLEDEATGNYMNQLAQLAGIGQNAAGTLTSAGQQNQSQSTSSGKSKNGMGKFLGAAAGAVAASDRRLKRDIKAIGTTPEGLTKYEWYYKANPFFKYEGVMADEVAAKKPEALGPVINGYMTVDYSKLEL